MSDNSRDICECGDYRRQHVKGKGYCLICEWHVPPIISRCMEFKLDSVATRQALTERGVGNER